MGKVPVLKSCWLHNTSGSLRVIVEQHQLRITYAVGIAAVVDVALDNGPGCRATTVIAAYQNNFTRTRVLIREITLAVPTSLPNSRAATMTSEAFHFRIAFESTSIRT